ncbi:hypothetical protein GF361_05820 [Candidatus Woesearchaeota archaeon]|nr:hypothetical protein [Candidatus Woesearchaeota archaeon]
MTEKNISEDVKEDEIYEKDRCKVCGKSFTEDSPRCSRCGCCSGCCKCGEVI